VGHPSQVLAPGMTRLIICTWDFLDGQKLWAQPPTTGISKATAPAATGSEEGIRTWHSIPSAQAWWCVGDATLKPGQQTRLIHRGLREK
jgi:hypothetical protein